METILIYTKYSGGFWNPGIVLVSTMYYISCDCDDHIRALDNLGLRYTNNVLCVKYWREKSRCNYNKNNATTTNTINV